MPDLGRPGRRSSLRRLRTAAVPAGAGTPVGIVLPAPPREPVPLPSGAGRHQDRQRGSATITADAGRLPPRGGAGLPVGNAVLHAHREEAPGGLLGAQDGYRSKLTSEDRRIDGGEVAAPDPGSVHLGGAIEVFPGAEAARTRTERLQTSASRAPAHAEHARLEGRVPLRPSPGPTEGAADAPAEPLDAARAVRPTSGRNTADVWWSLVRLTLCTTRYVVGRGPCGPGQGCPDWLEWPP